MKIARIRLWILFQPIVDVEIKTIYLPVAFIGNRHHSMLFEGHRPVTVQGIPGAHHHRRALELHILPVPLGEKVADRALDRWTGRVVPSHPQHQFPQVFWGRGSDGKPDVRDPAAALDIHQREGLSGSDAPSVAVSSFRVGARSSPGRKILLGPKIGGDLCYRHGWQEGNHCRA